MSSTKEDVEAVASLPDLLTEVELLRPVVAAAERWRDSAWRSIPADRQLCESVDKYRTARAEAKTGVRDGRS